MNADVTIFIPVYKAEAFVRDAIESVLAQTYSAFNLIIAVEPTDDGSATICREYASDPRVEVVENPERLGWVGNVNACLDRVKTPYFAFCFHDDALEPIYIEVLRDVLENNPSAVAAYGAMRKFGAVDGVSDVASVVGTPAERAISRLQNAFSAFGLKSLQRSDLILDGLRMPDIGKQGFAADWPYDLAFSIAGDFITVPDVVYRKRFWSESVTAGWQKLDAETRAENVVELQAEMLRVVADAGFDLNERQRIVQLILNRVTLKYGRSDDTTDLLTTADHGERFAPALLIADLLAPGVEPQVKMQDADEVRREAAFTNLRLAKRLLDLGQNAEALQLTRQAMRLDPKSARAQMLLSRLLAQATHDPKASLEDAAYHAMRATELELENAAAWLQRARVMARRRERSDVRASIETALRFGLKRQDNARALLERAERNLDKKTKSPAAE